MNLFFKNVLKCDIPLNDRLDPMDEDKILLETFVYPSSSPAFYGPERNLSLCP